MTNFVQQINDAIKVRVAAVLGSDYTELDYVLNLERNHERNSVDKFGVRPLSADSFDGVLRKINLEQPFEIILADAYLNRDDDDTPQREATFVLFDKLDEIFKDLLGEKAGIPDVILQIRNPSMAEPEYLDEDKLAVLRGTVSIQWRRSTS